MTTTTPKSVFSLDSLTKSSRGKKTAAQSMMGSFITPMFKTKDYVIEMVSYVANKVQDEPTNGVYFRLTTSDEVVIESPYAEGIIKKADEYSQKQYDMIRVNIQFNIVRGEDFNYIKVDSHTKDMHFTAPDVIVSGIHKNTVMDGYGFINKASAKKVHKKFGLFVPSLAK